MSGCLKVTTLWLNHDWSTNLRFMATAAGRVNTESSKRRSKSLKKDVSYYEKKQEKLIREKLIQNTTESSKNHVYNRLFPWQSSQELAEHLRNTEVYNNDGLIALNKPYGVGMTKLDRSKATGPHTTVETLNMGITLPHVPAMSQVLPFLKEQYAADHLEIVKSTERWSSGLMLLSTSSKLTEKIQKCLRRCKAMSQPAMTYRAITVGLPSPASIATKVATKLEYVHNTGKVIKAQVSKWHFLRVWATYCYSPILGDHLYSGRVKTLMGRKIIVSHHNTYLEPQNLPDNLYSKLALPPRSSEMVPCHLHLSTVTLCQFSKDKSDLVLSAAPPEHFMWTCKQLGLQPSDEEEEHGHNESDKIQ
ncbi:mitochondrial mRNA pseudouridine synthase RPUSD3-like isoform X2 [Portunus trituberculatus]|uniref:mitochondrial mRNA pseudouridine synthase RPUSD3-like isoform X2 n=1 Tax=Portunus trituberculatus TaxID=210409 RepID=UPI001E1CD1D7|nr:mitochondrial mRNA pseudouridine synthase RPUSD3-like isoform X2 [Portunus trituberculatus]